MATATKTDKAIYWIATGYMLFLMMVSVVNYHLFHERMAGAFSSFGYPTYLVYPLAYLKLIGVIKHRLRAAPCVFAGTRIRRLQIRPGELMLQECQRIVGRFLKEKDRDGN